MTSLKRSTRIFIRLFCIKNSKMVCDSSCPHCDRISLKVMHQIGLQFSVLIFFESCEFNRAESTTLTGS